MVDASHSSYKDGKGHYAYFFAMGNSNAPFCIKTSKIRIQTLSSTESEYVALAFAVREALYTIRLLKDLGFYDVRRPMIFYEDNQPVIDMLRSTKSSFHSTKHINVRFHFIKDLYHQNEITIQKIDTDLNVADMFTKALSVKKFISFRDKLLNDFN